MSAPDRPSLGVPEHARREWDALHEQIRRAGPTPCAGPDRDAWVGTEREQRRVADHCLDCAVMVACLAYAETAGEREGTWGGLTPRQRTARRRTGAA